MVFRKICKILFSDTDFQNRGVNELAFKLVATSKG